MSSDPTDTFRQEARELLEQLEQGLLDLEQNPGDADLVNSVFRALHTIKGSGAMFGFTDVAAFVHEFETAFDKVRKGLSPITPELVAVALDAKDHVHHLIETPDAATDAGDAILAALRGIVEPDRFPAAPMAQSATVAANVAPQVTGRWRIRFKLPEDALVHGTNPLLLLGEIADLGSCEVTALIDSVPTLDVLDPEACHLGWQVDLAHPDPTAALDDVFLFLKDGMELSIEPLAAVVAPEPISSPVLDILAEDVPVLEADEPIADAAPVRTQREPREPKTETAERAPTSLRVPAERLDELMDRVGELVIAQARLSQMAAQSSDGNLKTIAEELERLSSGLRDTTMGIRMVPIGSLFSRFRRLVHDLSRDLDKEIEFITTGEDTELDKTMIERLADPLVHLIRNSVDHGLETAEQRIRAGKPVKGTVRLSAVYAGAEVAISVTDDGAGLNAARIRAKAEEQGLLTPESRIADHDLFQLIFAPGFSTAKEVTSLSGRGVGMDVVKRTIDGLRGKIELSTRPGEGTTATLRLPLTLAIIEGMLVRVGNGRYSIPLSAVEECVELPAEVATHSRGRNFLDIRGSLVPFLRLRDLFNTPGDADTHQKVVIISSGEGRAGLVVDQIIGNNQTVIKQLSKLHTDLETFSGATILGDGTVALILDTSRLVSYGQAHEEKYRNTEGRAAA
ncbi:chemotaxis protein CheA [Devosia sp. Root413D1]|uniref:chemotaxis protein CheA n=1 Tax=Devosia sp. Root413D1 TaxID=1736531 RepID=UPI0006F41794|nr:chemotaxis protein CheA [Devosia sp. Root413D1]KQW79240.1 chemotaxis protein CheA [Devosia sp. Root413D1]